MVRCLFASLLIPLVLIGDLRAQSRVAAEPIVGLRDNRPRQYAFKNAHVIVEPGQSIPDATLLVDGTSITDLGTDIKIPAGFMTIDCTGKSIYAGLIDAWSEVDVSLPDSQPAHWNAHVLPQRRAADVASRKIDDAAKLRSQGFTARVIAPEGGIIKGGSCVVLLSDSGGGRKLLMEKAWQHLQLTVPRRSSSSKYPNSPMGAAALLRQTMYDAIWYRDVWNAYEARPDLTRPETNLALDSLSKSILSDTFVIDAPNERMAIRAEAIAREFSLQMIVRGSGREYRQLDEIVSMNRPVLVPVAFPDTPDVSTGELASRTALRDLMHWQLAPENPARLSEHGVSICLTTDGLDDVGDFLKQLRKAVFRGLHPDAALAAVTTTPARLLSMEDHVGQVRPGMLANFVITDGDLLDDDTEIIQCWVAGEQFIINPIDGIVGSELVGTWLLEFRAPGQDMTSLHLKIHEKANKLSAEVGAADPNNSDADDDEGAVTVKDLLSQRDRLTAAVNLHQIEPSLPDGVSQLELIVIARNDAASELHCTIRLPNGQSRSVNVSRVALDQGDQSSPSDTDDGNSDAPDDPRDDDTPATPAAALPPIPTLVPLGAYGMQNRITDQPTVLFRGATVWTCDQIGTLESADVLIRDGFVVDVGPQLDLPPGCRVIDARGKHITPGLIDCHSHMGTDGGVNESGQAVTAEVRIGDFIDNSDINIYRQAAGGLTVSNILHGSANPIGGQNQVIKLRWGETMDGLRMTEAPAGIKFALGENVKRNQSRYPNTRMGVEQIIRDQFLAAREYDAKWKHWNSGQRDILPPRVDLQLQALAEVQSGDRWIHCHSYRQDEIVATLDLLEEFGIRIGTLQHIMEGYKVADRMAQHGAMGSAFSDWWAYKFEVFDAIAYNGALMHEQGVVVSFNSDDRELARHLNTEAAKATKYGGVPEAEALKFVTLNPAKQLRIDQYVGSLAAGKHADLVLWSGRPLSTLSRCEQTWIDGKLYFDLKTDRAFRQRDAALRAQLIQQALSDGKKDGKPKDPEVSEEDRWVRTDIYCAAHGALDHGQITEQTNR